MVGNLYCMHCFFLRSSSYFFCIVEIYTPAKHRSLSIYDLVVIFSPFPFRLEQDVTAKEALLLTEKQAHEATRKTLTETQEKSEELLKKIHDNDKHILQLQFTIQRSLLLLFQR